MYSLCYFPHLVPSVLMKVVYFTVWLSRNSFKDMLSFDLCTIYGTQELLNLISHSQQKHLSTYITDSADIKVMNQNVVGGHQGLVSII